VHTVLQNVTDNPSFNKLTHHAFFNLVSSFDIPVDILNLLERQSAQGPDEKLANKDRTLHEMRQIRMKAL